MMKRIALMLLVGAPLFGACSTADSAAAGSDVSTNIDATDGAISPEILEDTSLVEGPTDVTEAADVTDVTEEVKTVDVAEDTPPTAPDTSAVDASQDTTSTGDADAAAPVEVVEEVAAACPVCGPSEASAEVEIPTESLTPDLERTRDNPLKGLLTSYLWGEPANDFPDQMEFLYLPMKDLWDASGETFEAGLEPLLSAAAERGHHVVLRVYIDYPTKPAGLPDYLVGTVPCSSYEDHGGGCSPDYEHPLLLEAMTDLLSELGDHYDGDNRLGALQIGLLGFWGEWHTWPHGDWFPSLEVQNALLTAADDAFSTTQIQVRYPKADSVSLDIGFHDDSFAHSTLGDIDWFFWPSMVTAGADNRWQEVLMGGELRPELQDSIFEEGYVLDTYAQDFDTCVETTHATYMLNYKAFNADGTGYQGPERDKAEASALAMGYTFEITGATAKLWGLHEGNVEAEIQVSFTQTGVAPFYYPLFPSLHSGTAGQLASSAQDLRGLLPGETLVATFPLGEVPPEVFLGPMEIHFSSEILQPNQRVQLGTQTPWTDQGGETALQWTFECQVGEGTFPLGAVTGETDSGCPCVCDVDGVARTCDGTPCP